MVGMGEGRTAKTVVPVRQPAHRVVEMGDAGTAGEGGTCDGVVAERMADLRANALVFERVVQGAVHVDLGRKGDDPHRRPRRPVRQEAHIRRDREGRLSPELSGVQEGPFEMGAEYSRLAISSGGHDVGATASRKAAISAQGAVTEVAQKAVVPWRA